MYRSLADGLRISRRGFMGERRPVPNGPVHAARPTEARTLCGEPVGSLLEFSSRLFPFEGFSRRKRCETCHRLAAHPAG